MTGPGVTGPVSDAERVARLEQMVEHMATRHVIFYNADGSELHPDWCPLCRLEKAEQIGAPSAIADWVESVVVPMLAAKKHIPEAAAAKGMVHHGCSAGDLIQAIRESTVLLSAGRDYDIALRPDTDGDDPFDPATLCDDIVVRDVATFRAEKMDTNAWWVCCHLRGGERLTFDVRAVGRPARIEWTTAELPAGDFRFEHQVSP